MPVLDLPDLNQPHGMYLAQIAVRAVMAWPTDAATRRRYVAIVMAHHLGELEAAADGLPDPAQAADWFETIAAIREHEEWQQTWDFLESWFNGGGRFAAVAVAPGIQEYQALMNSRMGDQLAAGLILALVRRMARHPELRGGPSVKKAIFLLEHVPAPGGVPRNSNDLWQAWSDYKPVSHFCAALFDCIHETMDETGSPEAFAVRMQQRLEYGFDSFLAEAEAYQSFGLSFRPWGKSLPLLDPVQTWILPAERQWQPTPMVAAPLNDYLLSVLRNYRAPSAY